MQSHLRDNSLTFVSLTAVENLVLRLLEKIIISVLLGFLVVQYITV